MEYNQGSGLISVEATSVSTDTLATDDINSFSGIINFNASTLSNVQNMYVNNNATCISLTSSNINASNTTSSIITSSNITSSNITSSNISSSNLTSRIMSSSNLTSSNITSSFVTATNLTSTNIGIGTIPSYNFDVSGTTVIRNGNAFYDWSKNQLMLSYDGGTSYRHAINTRHYAAGGVLNSIDFLLWDSNVSSTSTGTKNTMSITASGVGINTSNPTTALHVIGGINATSNIVSIREIQASNLNTSNLIIYRGSNVLDTDGKIDYNIWLKNSPIQTSNDGTIIIAPVVITNIINNVITNVSTGTGADGDENYDPDNTSNPIYVHWRNIIYHPFYCRTGTDEQVAFGSNVFIEKNSKIYGVDAVDLIKTDAGRIRKLDTNLLNPIVFYDFSNQEMFLKVINCNSNINASNIITSNIITNTITSSNVTSSNINASNISTASFTSTNLFSSNIVSSNCFSSNIINVNLWSSNISSSNITSCNYYGVMSYLSNMITSNLSSSNVSTSNLSTNLLQATSVNSQTSIITTMTATTLSASNITSCNLTTLSNNYHNFSNLSWKFNDSNIYQGVNNTVVAIGKSNATEKLDIQGNIKVSGGGSFANNNFVISSNTSVVHCLTINNSNIFRTDGTIGNDFLTQLNILAGNSNFAGTLGDIYNPLTQSSNLLTNWNNVVWKPLYHDSNYNLGFSSNVYYNRFSQLCTTEPSWDYTKTSNGLYKTFNTPFVRSNVVIDFNTYTATLCNIITSNATISNNIFASNVNASNVTTSNLISRNANLSNLWASNIGINQVNPLYNLDVNGSARVQSDLLVNSNTTSSNIRANFNLTASNLWIQECGRLFEYGAGLTNQTTPMEIINTYTGGTYGSASMALKVSNSNGINVGLDQCTANAMINGGFDATGIYMSMGVSNHYGIVPNSLVIRSGGNVGIGTSNPSFRLDVAGTGLRLQGGSGATPSTLFINSTGVANTTSVVQFVNASHQIACTDTSPYQTLGRATATGHNIYYISAGHVFGGNVYCSNNVGIGTSNPSFTLDVVGNARASNLYAISNIGIRTTTPAQPLEVNGLSRLTGGLQISGINTAEFGYDVSGKQTDAGKIGYATFTSGCLDIIGAGTTSGSRKVKLYDNVEVATNLSVGGGITLGGSGTSFQNMIFGSSNVGTNLDRDISVDLTYSLGGAGANYSVFPSVQQSTAAVDSFSVKWVQTGTGGSLNNISIIVYRNDANGWASGITVHWMIVKF